MESEEQTLEIAARVKKAGADMLRGGAFKPRTSPYSFQGLGLRGLKILEKARRLTGLPVVSEVLDPRDVPWMCEYVDVLQVGARNMQNFALLKEVGKARQPVLLKRGMYSTLSELLNCAEYILNEGNANVILCERGIRTFETCTRNTLDLSAVAARMLAREKPRLTAVIANRLCAELYGLEVVKENIEDHAHNITRFLVLSRQEKTERANKCSLIFSVPHQTGVLFKVLRVFADAGINLTRIESFPDRQAPERYSFFLDFQSDSVEADRARVSAGLAAHTVQLKDLGCYREIPGA